MNRQPHARAQVTYLTAEQGGRQTPVFSAYRGQIHYEGEHEGWDAEQFFIGRDVVKPGESSECEIYFASPEKHLYRVGPGIRFRVQEGGRVVGNGVITEILWKLTDGRAV
jgi:translation elongation factor EF-Tu-like GTPase